MHKSRWPGKSLRGARLLLLQFFIIGLGLEGPANLHHVSILEVRIAGIGREGSSHNHRLSITIAGREFIDREGNRRFFPRYKEKQV
jgi:hypothetical protein